MGISADHRHVPGEEDPEGLDRARAQLRTLIDLRIQLADSLLGIWRTSAFTFEGAASLSEFVARAGGDPREAWSLLHLGLALEAFEELEEEVRAGDIPIPSASALGRLVRREAIRPGDDWLEQARRRSIGSFRRLVRRRLAEVDQQVPAVVEMQFLVPEQTKTAFDRCRRIASRRADEPLSYDRTFGVVVDEYLAHHGAEQEGGMRRVPPTGSRPASRYVPREVVRALRRRSQDRCEVPGCTRVAEEICHIRPHRQGSGRELDDLWHGCHRHHVLYDASRLAFAGWTETGRPRFRTPDGTLLEPPDDDPEGDAGGRVADRPIDGWSAGRPRALAGALTGPLRGDGWLRRPRASRPRAPGPPRPARRPDP